MEVSEIIESVDILEYISQYCDLVEKQGEYWGLSPLKEENTPSFSVNSEKQRFFDFSSGKGGNVLEFICQYNDCSFHRGLQILKEYANIDEGKERSLSRLDATSVAKKFRHKVKATKEAKSSILPDDYMDRYERNLEKMSVWEAEGISVETMDKHQVRYDQFSNRLVYPLRDYRGNMINVCGRTLDEDFKAKGLRKYTYFKPLGVLDTIYGVAENLESILHRQELILFEGAKSVMIADTWGIPNTGAILTSHLNDYQFKFLIKLGVKITFALDAGVDISQDKNIMRLIPYTQVFRVKNRDGVLSDTDAPVDKGMDVFRALYKRRERLR